MAKRVRPEILVLPRKQRVRGDTLQKAKSTRAPRNRSAGKMCSFPVNRKFWKHDAHGAQIDEMQSIVVEYRIAKEVADEADQNKKRLEAKVKGWLRDHEKRNIAANDFVVSWSTVAGRQSWSINNLVEAAKEAGVDIEPFRREGNPYDRLTIK